MKLGKLALAFLIAAAGLVVAPTRADAIAFVTSVDSGANHNCAVTGTAQIYCWGSNAYGQLGDGTTTNSGTPILVTGGHSWASVDAGNNFTCAVTTTGDGYCWGTNNYGQLGDGNHGFMSETPLLVVGSHTWASISTGNGASCGVTTTGGGYCWGYNNEGQLGDNTAVNADAPQLVSGAITWQSISAADESACGVDTSGDGYCWGKNNFYALGIGVAPTQVGTPTAVSGSHTWESVSAGNQRGCGVTDIGAGYCWGAPYVGDGTLNPRSTPVALDGGHTWTNISSGDGVVCGLDNANDAYCWGLNGLGAIGDGTTTNRVSPTLVLGSHDFVQISTGGGGGCGVTTTSALYCWGYNGTGQVGNGGTTTQLVPIVVIGLSSEQRSATVSGIVDPTLTFTVAGRATVCNGQTGTGFQTGSTPTVVSLGHLSSSVIGGGAQDLTLATNAGGGFAVYIRTSGTTPNAFRTTGGATVADVTGTHASPSASTAAGTAGFGYTTNDATIAFGSNNWAKLTATDESVMTAAAGVMSKSTCTGFQATVATTTAAGSYSTPIIYTAVPSF